MPSELLQEELASIRLKLRGALGRRMPERVRENAQTVVGILDARASHCSDETARELLSVGEALLVIVAAHSDGRAPQNRSE
jgi:hypothetical protein